MVRAAALILTPVLCAAPGPVQPLLERYCYGCHSSKARTGSFDVEALSKADFLPEFRRWETAAEQVFTHTMPPASARQPTPAERNAIVSWIDRQVGTAPLPPGSRPEGPALRRMTRYEYRHAIRKLTGIPLDLSGYLPPDGASQDGLPNNAGTLFLSGPQLEKLLAASEQLMSHAEFSPVGGLRFHEEARGDQRHEERIHEAAVRLAAAYFPAVDKHVEPARIAGLQAYQKRDWAAEAIAGGGTAEDFAKYRHYFAPLFEERDPERLRAIARAMRSHDDHIEYLRVGDHTTRFDVNVAGRANVYLLATDAGDGSTNDFAAWLDATFHFAGGTSRPAAEHVLEGDVVRNASSDRSPLHIFVQASDLRGIRDRLFKDPATMNRNNPLYRDNTIEWSSALSVKAPALVALKVPPGAQRFTVRGAMQDLARKSPAGMVQLVVSTQRPASTAFIPGERLTIANRTQQQSLRRYYDNLITKHFPSPTSWIRALDDHLVQPATGVIHLHPEEVIKRIPDTARTEREELARLWREYVLLASEPRIVRERAEMLLNGEYRRLMSRKAFTVKGRELTFAEVRELASQEIKDEVTVLDGLAGQGPRDLRSAAERHLAAFAMRAWRRPATAPEIDHLMGLYSSALAGGRATAQDAVRFAAQSVVAAPAFLYVRGDPMPGDPDALAEQFIGSWLRFREIADHDQPGEKVRQAMYQEALHFTRAIFREDRSILEFLDANYTYLNEDLAAHYGIRAVRGPGFRRVTVDPAQRGGLLGMGAILTLTSHPNRTSPVARGVYVLKELLGAPPPPPPPNASNEFEEKSAASGLSMRKQLEMHRANPACASCHRRVDPVGFALENFDPHGRIRATEDTRTAMADGRPVTSFAGLKRTLLTGRERNLFVRTFCRQLLAYKMGRAISYHDLAVLRRMEAALQSAGFRPSAALRALDDSLRSGSTR
ncbi:MAG: DUF1588 domain-containing protein [Acidobacteria bacterium]|nr:DUF1588 domain-containing protein [Acidobacteriota bacterium]